MQERGLMESRIVVKNKQTSLFPPTPLFASRIFKPTLLEKNALSVLDWIGWVSQGDTEHLTVANKLEMRMYKKERHMP